jgi:hypothetical protein
MLSFSFYTLLNSLESGITWKNLVDLNDRQQIWLKYNVPYSGGAIILIDSDGTILAVEPTVDEMRELLAERFES